jgi:hypothetical protein
MLSRILNQIDLNNTVSDISNKHIHQVAYSTSRTIMRYIQSDVPLLAYGYNPGNAIVIFEKQGGLIAYGCYLDSFPVKTLYPAYHWQKMEVETAIHLILTHKWEAADYTTGIDYTEPSFQWEVITTGELEITYQTKQLEKTLEQFQPDSFEQAYRIIRLKSNNLRVEVAESYCDYREFLKILQFFRSYADVRSIPLKQFPSIQFQTRVLRITDVSDALLDELQVQAISHKLQKAS